MNDAFFGREDELRALEDAYHRDGFQMAVVYGRRRIGKTTLLREFCKDKKSVFFTAIKTTVPRNTELFARAALEQLAPELSGLMSCAGRSSHAIPAEARIPRSTFRQSEKQIRATSGYSHLVISCKRAG